MLVPTTTAPASAALPASAAADTRNLGFLLARASAHWNESLIAAFAKHGFDDVRPSFGAVLLPLFEEDGLRMGQLCSRAHMPKQTMTSLVAQMESAGLVERERDPADGRARLVRLSARARRFKPVAERILSSFDAQISEHLSRTTTTTMKRGLRRLLEIQL